MNWSMVLDALTQSGHLADMDRQFARFAAQLGDAQTAIDGAGGGELDDAMDSALDGAVKGQLEVAAALVSLKYRSGHTCLPLNDCAGKAIGDLVDRPQTLPSDPAENAGPETPDENGLANSLKARLPDADTWRGALMDSELVAVPANLELAAPQQERPPPLLILDADNHLYLNRIFQAERFTAERMVCLAREPMVAAAKPAIDQVLDALFDADEELPKRVARIAAEGRLCIVTGGPGTGKTTLAAKIIALLVQLGLASPFQIALAAPTGKAAARLRESIGLQMQDLCKTVPALRGYEASASTLHRLLNSGRAAQASAILVDECSMVDLALMQRLLAASIDARLVLLGDASQLSSVQPGAVFGDLCAVGGKGVPVGDCIVKLTRSHRFPSDSGIGRLAKAIVDGNGEAALAALMDPQDPATKLLPLQESQLEGLAMSYAKQFCKPVMEALLNLSGPDQARQSGHDFPFFPKRRILCAHRQGPFGSVRFNRLVYQQLRGLNMIAGKEEFYPGRAIIITRNHPSVGLANGDTGVVLRTTSDQRRVWFPGIGEDGAGIDLAPSRLPEHESFFALTVHKSQGSEYDQVAVIPGPGDSFLATRELLYTAVTRARKQVYIYGSGADVLSAVGRRTERSTGLSSRLMDAVRAVATDQS